MNFTRCDLCNEEMKENSRGFVQPGQPGFNKDKNWRGSIEVIITEEKETGHPEYIVGDICRDCQLQMLRDVFLDDGTNKLKTIKDPQIPS